MLKENKQSLPTQNDQPDTFVIDGEIYHYINGQYYDDQFCLLSKSVLIKVIQYRIKALDYKSTPPDKIVLLIKECKENEICSIAKYVCEQALNLNIFNTKHVKTILPIYTSCCRKLNLPKEAISQSKEYLSIYPGAFSPALDTSLAAAHCDIKDYKTAIKYANRAYAQSHFLPPEDRKEISLVYKRLKSKQS